MLQVLSKYRIAKRLGAGVFEQTQTQKFALVEANSIKKRGRGPSDYGRQLIEKQKVRFTYGLSERQLSNYAKVAFTTAHPTISLHKALNMRADMVAYAAGLAPTRRGARQAVSHGHFTINGVRVTTPSYKMKIGDVMAVRNGNQKSPLYAGLAEKNAEGSRAIPAWVDVDIKTLSTKVVAEPQYAHLEGGLDYATVFEFYSR